MLAFENIRTKTISNISTECIGQIQDTRCDWYSKKCVNFFVTKITCEFFSIQNRNTYKYTRFEKFSRVQMLVSRYVIVRYTDKNNLKFKIHVVIRKSVNFFVTK